MHRCLVVANRTLGGPELLEAIKARLAGGPTKFWVLVPATPTTHLGNDFTALSCQFPVDPNVVPSAADAAVAEGADQAGTTQAVTRLDDALRSLRELGASADGAVGGADPLAAIDDLLHTQEFDEILLSTLPPGLSRWLSLDLPHRLRRRTDLPLTVITARHDAGDRPTREVT